VLFIRTSDLVQRLQVARRELALESALTKLNKYHLLILDDIAYVNKDQAETSVLFELIGTRYERRSMLITANQPFGEWGKVFPGQAMTLAAIDRLVHHATILEMNVESYRSRHNAADLLRCHCPCGFLFAANNYVCCSRTWKAAPESFLARLWLFAWLSFARTDQKGERPCPRSSLLVWRARLLPRPLERRWFRALLDTDTHRTTLELRIGKGTTAIGN
jgi:IstB-like ATP binding protein